MNPRPAASWLLFALFTCNAGALMAQSYPSKPIRVIIATTAGGTTDTISRLAGQDLTQRLGQPLVMENRPGGNGVSATDACARAGADGHTLCIVSTNSMSFAPHTVSKLPYDTERDIRAVVHLYNLIEGMVANPALPANSVKELQALALVKPGSLNFGTLGAGSQPDVFRQWLAERWKTEIVGIHYKGAQPIVQALVAGEIHFTQISLGNSAGQLRAGKIKALAQGGGKRSRQLPDVPTFEEAGLDFHGGGWWGVIASAAVPDAIVHRINAEYARVLREPKLVDFMDNQFLEPVGGPPETFAAFIRRDRERAGEIVKRYNIPRE